MPDRRQDLLKETKKQLKTVFMLFQQLYDQFIKAYNQAGQQKNANEFNTYKKLMQVLLQANLAFVVDWIDYSELFKNKFVSFWCSLLYMPDFKQVYKGWMLICILDCMWMLGSIDNIQVEKRHSFHWIYYHIWSHLCQNYQFGQSTRFGTELWFSQGVEQCMCTNYVTFCTDY